MLTLFVSAGVAGLTTALLLSKNPKYRITVAAKYMPGDYNAAEYASPWAGANYLPSVIFALNTPAQALFMMASFHTYLMLLRFFISLLLSSLACVLRPSEKQVIFVLHTIMFRRS